MEAKV
jgi:hypothetical protein